MKIREFSRTTWLPRPVAEIFPFFADAANLQRLTPRWLKFEILTPRQIDLRRGTLIDYRLRIHGIPLRWQSEITAWDPPNGFTDEQRRGPYRMWRHQHRFVERNGGTEIIDIVHYAVAFDWLVHRFFVKRDIEQIFDFREQTLRGMFPV